MNNNKEKGNEEEKRYTYISEIRKRQRSYAEAVKSNESSEEEQNRDIDWKNKGKKKVYEENREKEWKKIYDDREETVTIKRREQELDSRGSTPGREEFMTSSPAYTNLTSLSTTIQYMTEEVRNLCRIMERRLNLAEEMFLKFEDRQRKHEDLFIRLVKGDTKQARETAGKIDEKNKEDKTHGH